MSEDCGGADRGKPVNRRQYINLANRRMLALFVFAARQLRRLGPRQAQVTDDCLGMTWVSFKPVTLIRQSQYPVQDPYLAQVFVSTSKCFDFDLIGFAKNCLKTLN